MPRLLRRLLLLLLSAAHETPLSVACASLTMLPAPTAVEKASRGLERPLPLLRLLLLPLLSAAHETPLWSPARAWRCCQTAIEEASGD